MASDDARRRHACENEGSLHSSCWPVASQHTPSHIKTYYLRYSGTSSPLLETWRKNCAGFGGRLHGSVCARVGAVEGELLLDLSLFCDYLSMAPCQHEPSIGQPPMLRLQLAAAEIPRPPPSLCHVLQAGSQKLK